MVRLPGFLLLIFGVSKIAAHPWWYWLGKIGGVGLLCLGLTDGSVLPVPGGTDALTILLAARHHDLWIYYAGMATLGSVVGGSLTYRFGKAHGEQALLRRVGVKRAKKFSELFTRWGFYAVAVPAMLPVPVSPFLLTAGATRYPRKKFLTALTLGRAAKFLFLALLAASYGRRAAVRTLDHYGALILWGIGIALIIGVTIAGCWAIRRPDGSSDNTAQGGVTNAENVGA